MIGTDAIHISKEHSPGFVGYDEDVGELVDGRTPKPFLFHNFQNGFARFYKDDEEVEVEGNGAAELAVVRTGEGERWELVN